jgi:hypothetical protein
VAALADRRRIRDRGVPVVGPPRPARRFRAHARGDCRGLSDRNHQRAAENPDPGACNRTPAPRPWRSKARSGGALLPVVIPTAAPGSRHAHACTTRQFPSLGRCGRRLARSGERLAASCPAKASPSATASGSPDRLLCPDPVRYMSVITGPAESVAASCGDLPIDPNVRSIPGLPDFLAAQDDISERNTDERRWPNDE